MSEDPAPPGVDYNLSLMTNSFGSPLTDLTGVGFEARAAV